MTKRNQQASEQPEDHSQDLDQLTKQVKSMDWGAALVEHRERLQQKLEDIAQAQAESMSVAQRRWVN